MDAYNAGQTWLFTKDEVGQLPEHHALQQR